MTRGLVALALLGTIVAVNIEEPRGMSPELLASLRTLVIAVVAFYFGSRLRERAARSEESEGEPVERGL